MVSFPYKHVIIVGATGCGKSTLAEKLAKKINVNFIELDSIYWKPGWVDPDPEEFRKAVDLATRSPGWVFAGNYGIVRDLVWSRAQALVWLDYPFFLVLGRLLRRIWTRWRSHELLWEQIMSPFGCILSFGQRIHSSIGYSKHIGSANGLIQYSL
jgi:adenylate kinase family enzyme